MDWKSKRIRAILETALAEDKAASDVTTRLTVDPGARATATVIARQPCVVSGLGCIPVFLEIFSKLSESSLGRFEVVSHPEIFDGVRVRKNQALAVIRANAAAILSCERSILNLMQRMCGIATLTREYVQAIEGTGAEVLDTRKTIPGLRPLDRYAVCCGGGLNHRQDLQEGVLIKMSHIALAGGIPAALERALAGRKPGQLVQVEVTSLEELEQAIAGGAESILLQGMPPDLVKRAVKRIREALPEIKVEAACSITVQTARAFAEAGVNYVTVGALTHSVPAVDLTMRIVPDES
jgi:nicotinate-nucleotide pyrophosphorylase (carboxylating)